MREDHRDAVLVGRANDLLVAHGAARLHDRGDAMLRGGVDAVAKRKERVRSEHGALYRQAGRGSQQRGTGGKIEAAGAIAPGADDDKPSRVVPGEVLLGDGDVELLAGRDVATLTVLNTGDRPVQVGSHYHFFETNPALKFDREKARGMRLAIPSGTAVRI